MNSSNVIHLEGQVHRHPLNDEAWTRWKRGGRGQVRFWLAVSRELAGEGCDLFLCAIEPHSAEEVAFYERELKAGRWVALTASARNVSDTKTAWVTEERPSVIFVAAECSFDGAALHDAHRVRKAHATGKMAAAGEHLQQEPELALEVKS